MDKPLRLAVVIPTFNRAHVIGRAVQSVLTSQRDDIAVIVVDDGSVDDTGAVLGRIGDPRLSYLRIARSGANRARNLGAAATTAPLLAFLDSDDEFRPGRADRLIDFFAARPEIDAVLDGFFVRDGRREHRSGQVARDTTGSQFVHELVAHAIPLTSSAITIRRAAFEAVGGFDESLGRHQDRDLLIRMAQAHRIALGTATDVIKHQSNDSFSRLPTKYIEGLDALVARHPVFRHPRYTDVLGYLCARVIVRAVANFRLGAAWQEARALAAAGNLRLGVFSALARYGKGRRIRRAVEAEIRAAAAAPHR